MSDYLALARRYRPQTFADVVGQDHIVRALQSALSQNRLHHAYLFTGLRGSGKTSLARLFAKALNCEQGIQTEPCNTCTACTEIMQGNYVDLIEVDAASRTKVEDTRDLLDQVQYAPSQGRYKVYLIDEVHMLSNHSFNALLKTLEEPPAHVKFLLATTELDKIPVTVRSRCLNFNLKPIPENYISEQLTRILTEQNIPFEPAALPAISRAGQGSLRDALTLTEQLIGFSGQNVTLAATYELLGIVAADTLTPLLQAVSQKDSTAAYAACDTLAQNGVDMPALLDSLIETLQELTFLNALPGYSSPILESLSPTPTFSNTLLQLYYQIALQAKQDLPFCANPTNAVKMTLLRMIQFSSPAQSASIAPATQAQAKPQPITMPPNPAPAPTPAAPAPTPMAPPKTDANTLPIGTMDWQKILQQLKLQGVTATLAQHAAISRWEDTHLYLVVDPSQAALLNAQQHSKLTQALQETFNASITLHIEHAVSDATPAKQAEKAQAQAKSKANQHLMDDKALQSLLDVFNVEIDPEKTKPVSDA